jgi:hypothetical protein
METLTKTYRLPNRDRVVVTVNIGTTDRQHTGTDHSIVEPGAATVSFTGDLYPYRCRNAVACGQITDDVPAGPVRDLWQRWHLNGMRSHCDHQNRAIAWDVVAPCEATGYRAGTAWLFETVPADVLDMIREAMR